MYYSACATYPFCHWHNETQSHMQVCNFKHHKNDSKAAFTKLIQDISQYTREPHVTTLHNDITAWEPFQVSAADAQRRLSRLCYVIGWEHFFETGSA